DPEGLDADDLFLLVAHRSRHVHDEDHDRVGLRQRAGPPGAVPTILAHRRDDRVLRVVAAGHDLPAQRLTEGALEVPQRLGPGAPDADVAILLGDDPLLALGLDARQLQLFAHDLGQLFQRQLDLQRVLSRLVARLAAAVGVGIRLAQAVADLPLPLPHPAAIAAAEPEPRHRDLRQWDRDQVLALPPDQLALRDVLPQVLL